LIPVINFDNKDKKEEEEGEGEGEEGDSGEREVTDLRSF
jgi:hypothetical protein